MVSGEIDHAKRSGFHHDRAIHRSAEDISQKLHRDVARRHTAIDPEHGVGRNRPISAHRFEQVAGLVADRLKRRLRDLGGTGIARQAQQGAARLGIPIGRAEPDERRHKIDLLGRIGPLS